MAQPRYLIVQFKDKWSVVREDHLFAQAGLTLQAAEFICDALNGEAVAPAPMPKRETFDLEAVYELFPKKVGKATGLAILKRQIRSRDKYDALLAAVKRFAEINEGRDLKYVKQFDTWARHWEDSLTDGVESTETRGPDFGDLFGNLP